MSSLKLLLTSIYHISDFSYGKCISRKVYFTFRCVLAVSRYRLTPRVSDAKIELGGFRTTRLAFLDSFSFLRKVVYEARIKKL